MDWIPRSRGGGSWRGCSILSNSSQLAILDGLTEDSFFVLGTEGGYPFFLPFTKGRRWPKKWDVDHTLLPGSRSIINVTSLPPKSNLVSIWGIFDQGKRKLSSNMILSPSPVEDPPQFASKTETPPANQARQVESRLQPSSAEVLPQPALRTETPPVSHNRRVESVLRPSVLPQPALTENPPVRQETRIEGRLWAPPTLTAQVSNPTPPKEQVFNHESLPLRRKRIVTMIGRGGSFESKASRKDDTGWSEGDSEESELELKMEKSLGDRLGPAILSTPNFWMRHGVTPTMPEQPAGQWRESLRGAPLRQGVDLSAIVRLGMAVSTMACHRRIISWISSQPEPPAGMGLATWLLRIFSKEAADKKWLGSTLTTKLAVCQGALAALPVYRMTMFPVILKGCAEWRLGLKGAGNTMRRAMPKQARVLTPSTLRKTISLEPLLAVRIALEVAWVTAGRGGDVVRLRTCDIWSDAKGTWVRFVIGKTASSQPYTVSTAKLSQEALKYLETRRTEEGATPWLFPGILGEQLKDAMRRVDPLLEQRSIRRGALQLLSLSPGMTDERLLHYSQHKSVHTLRRYLDFG